MKTLRFFLNFAVIIFSSLVFTQCNKHGDPEPDLISVSPKSLEFEASIENAPTKSVTVTTNLDTWEVFNTTPWIKTDKYDEKTLSVAVITNYTDIKEPRIAEIRVKAGSVYDTIQVTQKAKIQDNLAINPTSLSFKAAETGEKSVAVTTNASEWKASKPSDVTWLSIEVESSKALKVRVPSANTQITPRTANITFTAGDAEPVILTVTQAGTTVVVGPCFGYAPNSTYYATGTPSLATNPGPSSWSGSVTLSCASQFYSITNWGGSGRMVFCDYINNKIILDSDYRLVEGTGGFNGYFKAIILNNAALTWEEVPNFEVKYNTSTRVLDFSGTYKGYPVIVGIVAIEESTKDLKGVYGDAYSNAKLTLTPTSSAPSNGNAEIKTEIKSDIKKAQATGSLKVTPFEGNKVYTKVQK
ncbi:hypothetical protein FACS189426_10150 [Bacteroidia bacterium]|nr:hypothetical protein FACS189426_10150 [Bacteroidia bacterium]GHV70907.1 hypothetical protein FACS189420_3930 [Bacteroidia bacterium]